MSKMLERFRAARRAGVPIVAIATPNPASTMRDIDEVIAAMDKEAKLDSPAALQWDCMSGFRARPGNERGREAIQRLLSREAYAGAGPEVFAKATLALDALRPTGKEACDLPPESVVYMLNAHRAMTSGNGVDAEVVQGIWNLRDPNKAAGIMLVLFGPSFTLPPELQSDVVQLNELLPEDATLGAIITMIHASAAEIGVPPLTDSVLTKAVDALRGLPSYAAEQAAAMCLSETGFDLEELWETKRNVIAQTPGLSVPRFTETFGDVKGCENAKGLLRGLFSGPDRPIAIGWFDEIEKSGLAHTGDLSGVNSDALGVTLTCMQEYEWVGVLFIGHAGTGKSMTAKTAAAEFGVPCVYVDYGAMKGGIVGDSERMVRGAMKTLYGIGGKRVLIIATCNDADNIPTALKRRLTKLGIYMFDTPTREEKDPIWDSNVARFQLDPSQPRPDDTGWTGDNIYTCCLLAHRLRKPDGSQVTLLEAAKRIVPITKSDPDAITRLRRQAHNHYLSASVEGTYVNPDGDAANGDSLPPLRETARRIRS